MHATLLQYLSGLATERDTTHDVRPTGQFRPAHAVHADFAAVLEAALSGYLSRVSVSLLSLESVTHAQYQRQRGALGCRQAFLLGPIPGGALEVSLDLARALLRQLIPVDADEIDTPRPFSDIEMQLVHDALSGPLQEYCTLWAQHPTVRLRPDANNGQIPPGEEIYLATYAVRTPETPGLPLYVVLRMSAWRDLLHGTSERPCPAPSIPTNRLLDTIGDCPLPVRVLLGRSGITVRDIISLRKGDIICLDRTPDAPLEILVGRQPKLYGKPQRDQGHFVVTITGAIPTRGA